MNNKGMTLVELIVTFSLLLILVVGLYNLILEVKFQMDQKQVAKDLTEYSSTMNNEIHYNLLKDEPYAILVRGSSQNTWSCTARTGEGTCTASGTNFTIRNSSNNSASVSQATLNNRCQNIFPCAVYYYDSGSYRAIALNEATSNNYNPDGNTPTITNDLLKQNGIYYNNYYEPLPNPEDSEIRNIVVVEDPGSGEAEAETPIDDRPYITLEDGIFIINFAFYMIDGDTNYGFKIVYPFS